MSKLLYDRNAAVSYAEQWALSRNPSYYDFSELGGDCTNFVSQCLFAGCDIMNYSGITGWYYNDLNNRAASWTSVSFLYRFLISNRGGGPYARLVERRDLSAGDVIQLGKADGTFYHSLIVLEVSPYQIYVAAHSNDSLWRPISSYDAPRIRYLHISVR